MWACTVCSFTGNPSGFQKTKREIEAHLYAYGHHHGWYSYGGRNGDRTRVTVSYYGDKFAHVLIPKCFWKLPKRDGLTPTLYVVAEARAAAEHTVTLVLLPLGEAERYQPGQFAMVHVPSWEDVYFGEIPISVSGIGPDGELALTVRRAGPLSNRLTRARAGDVLALRGPFGNGWDLKSARGHDVLLVAGGCGLAPLRPAIRYIIDHRQEFGRVNLAYGAKTADDRLYTQEVSDWIQNGIDIAWATEPKMVTDLLWERYLPNTHAFVCGPEPMMLAVGNRLAENQRMSVQVSMERFMQCGMGECGMCNLPDNRTTCHDGPVFDFDSVKQFMSDGSFKRSVRRAKTTVQGIFGS